ncbi:pentapeptide repeat-containing protein [Rhodococcus jostii]|uniref:pentapeptide repeat-containing protein n=1 Tax=Rhodococcus jostii TaxID=132919 RepID=UPI003629F6BB
MKQIAADRDNLTSQIKAQSDNLTAQLQAQSDNLTAQLRAQEKHLEKQIEAQSEQLRATHVLEEARDLRTRYAAVTLQLSDKGFVVRMAGVYALASLADDWHAFGNDSERQVCIDLLCAQLRDLTAAADDDRKLRAALVKVIHLHTKIRDDRLPENGWSRCQFDLSGADLRRVQMPRALLFGPILDDCDLSGALLMGVQLSHAHMRRTDSRNAMLTYAHLRRVDLTDAKIDESTELTGIWYDNETTWPEGFAPPPSK